MRLAKIQISLRIRAVWSEPSLGVLWIANDAKFLQVDNKDSNQSDLSIRRVHKSKGPLPDVSALLISLTAKLKDGRNKTFKII